MEENKKPLGWQYNFGACVAQTETKKGLCQVFHILGSEDKPFLGVEATHSDAEVSYWRDASNNHETAIFRFKDPIEDIIFTAISKKKEPNRGLGWFVGFENIVSDVIIRKNDKDENLCKIFYPEIKTNPEYTRKVCYAIYQDDDKYVSIVIRYTTFVKLKEDVEALKFRESLMKELFEHRKLLEKVYEKITGEKTEAISPGRNCSKTSQRKRSH